MTKPMHRNRWPTSDSIQTTHRTPIPGVRKLVILLLSGWIVLGPAHAEPVIQRLPETSEPSADSIFFAPGATDLDPYAELAIQRHAGRLKAQPDEYVTLIAHTDELGSASLELARGQRRLDVVRKVLEDQKIQPSRIRTINQGSESVSSIACEDDACRRQRRRIDFIFHR